MTARKFSIYALTLFALLLASCADSKQKAIITGDRFLKAFVVDVDFGVLMRYSTGDAKRHITEMYEELGPDGVADMRRRAKEARIKYVLDEEKSHFSEALVTLVYELSAGPGYDEKYFAEIELSGGRGRWKVSFYII